MTQEPSPAELRQQGQSGLEECTTEELEAFRDEIVNELQQRNHDVDLEEVEAVELVNGQYVAWADLSAHPNLKAVKPWIMRVTGAHKEYTVDGEWLDKQKIDGKYHMDVSELAEGDIIKVSGASHTNKKHRYYRVVAVTAESLFFESEYGLKESEVLEEVG